MTLYEGLDKVLHKAASKALLDWGQEDGLEDLVQELWLWYLERPGTQQKLQPLTFGQQVATVKLAALQMLSKQVLGGNTFNDRSLYSADSIREGLRGESTNLYLQDILPLALDALNERTPNYAEAIRSRYTDGVVPARQSADEKVLGRAVKSLTDELNVTYLTTNHNEGKGSRNTVFPDSVKRKGAHGDPTGEIAMMLLENPDLRDEYLEDDGWDEIAIGEVEEAGEFPSNIFDGTFNGMGGSEMYRAAVMPDLFPQAKPMLIGNWPLEDRQMYCGGEYTMGYLRVVKGVA